ncbi:hypothetical protein SAMN04487905_10662 [Actinopolyspora xinjiangensis]|uniref:Uncharacterized protein n=1 Tax=Actinopolyspora xinjiangensis TaxID=405564 RepID=A0A1H0U5E4_9ACTN|nr:hypothetical protein [Actinopolyspora xinjiangensis]SDP61403.1 hypothetical protein SAMN04487905_10662 [Actinopolyspora xinjiangensis]
MIDDGPRDDDVAWIVSTDGTVRIAVDSAGHVLAGRAGLEPVELSADAADLVADALRNAALRARQRT